jgi:hypothetical protein
MKKRFIQSMLASILACSLASAAQASSPTYLATVSSATLSPQQTSTIPLGYPFASKTYTYGSDSTAAAFQTNKTAYTNYILSNLQEGVQFTGEGINTLDPQKLYFLFDYAPRVYFIYGYAGFIDGFGATIATVSAPTSKVLTGTTFTCFSDAHWNGSTSRTSTYPVLPGDFVQLPTVTAGQQLAFFCYSNESSSGAPANVWYNGVSNNSDGFQHMIAFFPDNSQYIIIGFEDYPGGGDQDCNDLMFVVDVGPNNAAAWRNGSMFPK